MLQLLRNAVDFYTFENHKRRLFKSDIRDAYTGLWNPKKYRSECGKKDTHLLDVMLLQRTGVNHGRGGALQCYAWLNTVFPEAYTAEEKEWVMRRYHHSCLA